MFNVGKLRSLINFGETRPKDTHLYKTYDRLPTWGGHVIMEYEGALTEPLREPLTEPLTEHQKASESIREPEVAFSRSQLLSNLNTRLTREPPTSEPGAFGYSNHCFRPGVGLTPARPLARGLSSASTRLNS